MGYLEPSVAMLVTVEEFLETSVPDGKAELVRGELRLTPPAGAPHGFAIANLLRALTGHVDANRLGRAFGDGFGYELPSLPQTVRVPDVSFVRADRLPGQGVVAGLLKLAPDLAAEVLSPSETASSLEEKLHDFTVAGTSLIWVVDPVRRTVRIMQREAPIQWLHEGDTLTGGSVLPGFSCAVVDIFEGIARDG